MKSSVHTDTGLDRFSREEIIAGLLSLAGEMNYGFACWRLPATDHIYFLVNFSDQPSRQKIMLEKSTPGFIVQSFTGDAAKEAWFLNADVLFILSEKKLQISSGSPMPERKEEFLQKLTEKLNSDNLHFQIAHQPRTSGEGMEKKSFTSIVRSAIDAIRENRFKKVVLARSKEIESGKNINPGNVFLTLCREYPNAFVSLLYTKVTGLWLTATPETLVSVSKDHIFRTIALAGTQKAHEQASPGQAVWSQKEIIEQALVGRYIINCFKSIRLREYEETGPYTIQSGNLFHLRTDYSVNMEEVNFPELGTVMLDLLHPTSAVCGMPKEVTKTFIQEHEQLDRGLFAGFLGPVNIDDESHVFVNLRCARLFEDRSVLYAGAGITEDSDPEKEFTETELKMDAIGRFLK